MPVRPFHEKFRESRENMMSLHRAFAGEFDRCKKQTKFPNVRFSRKMFRNSQSTQGDDEMSSESGSEGPSSADESSKSTKG